MAQKLAVQQDKRVVKRVTVRDDNGHDGLAPKTDVDKTGNNNVDEVQDKEESWHDFVRQCYIDKGYAAPDCESAKCRFLGWPLPKQFGAEHVSARFGAEHVSARSCACMRVFCENHL